MDSLTQIVLGAACGEAVLGKKIGNKALLFGAIGGTIPDLDVFVGRLLFNNEIQTMAFHRGFMHSILFSILGAFVLGWLFHVLYNNGRRKHQTTRQNWMILFFLALFTHPLLDSFTPYGTQLFAPFSNYRVALNTISVVDPLYTVPFLICLIIVMFYNRISRMRKRWLKYGLAISTFYLFLTCVNKLYINSIYKSSLEESAITYTQFQTQPTIFNNILWYGVAESETSYYLGFYSLFDKSNRLKEWITIEKNHEKLNLQHPDITTLSWFSKGYFNVVELENEGEYMYNDLRYPPLIMDEPKSSVFTFKIQQIEERWDMVPFESKFSDEATFKNSMQLMFARLRGID
ncbi:MAG: metal-dependent hydrolase [Winogradskyella sp.]|nr:metal-dependent hydrolase [Winogradskyella sp.]